MESDDAVMDLAALKFSLMAPDFDVEVHASKIIESGKDLAQYSKQLEKAEAEVDRMLQEQVESGRLRLDCD